MPGRGLGGTVYSRWPLAPARDVLCRHPASGRSSHDRQADDDAPLSLNLRTLPPRTETPSFSAHRVGHDADVHRVSHWPQKMIGVWSPHGAGQACLRTPSARDTFLERTLRVTAEVRHEALLGTGERRAAHPRCLSKPRGTQVSVAFSLCLTLDRAAGMGRFSLPAPWGHGPARLSPLRPRAASRRGRAPSAGTTERAQQISRLASPDPHLPPPVLP